jgi:hypothetical protein
MAYSREYVRKPIELLAEEETEALTSERAENVALQRIVFAIDAILIGELSSARLWLVDAERWVAESIRRRVREDKPDG